MAVTHRLVDRNSRDEQSAISAAGGCGRGDRSSGLAAPAEPAHGFNLGDAVFAALVLLSILPALLVRYPQSVDYLNHLARLFVLTAPADDPIHAFYRVHWHLLPNLGLELVGMPLVHVLPLEAVMKLIWVLCVFGPAAALWFLQRSLLGRTQPTLVLGAIALINLPLTVGLFNFVLGLALALAAVGLWFRMGDRAIPRSLLMLNAMGAVILVTHVAACASLALTIATLHVFRRPLGAAAMARRAAVIASGFILPLVLMIFIAGSSSAPGNATGIGAVLYVPAWKLQLATAPVFTGDFQADIIFALVLWTGLLAALLLGARCHPRLIAPLLVWLVVLVALPFRMGSATIIDLRQAFFPALLLIGAISFAPRKRAWSHAIMAIGVACVAARTVLLIPEWRLHDARVQSFRDIGAMVERGAKIIVGSAPEAPGACREPRHWAPFDEHTPVLLAIDRADFVSTLFAKPDVQPIEPTAAVRDIAEPDRGIVLWSDLDKTPPEKAMMTGETSKVSARDWRKDYDYLALRRLSCATEIAPQSDLVPIADSMTYRLYRIIHSAN